MVFIHLVKVFYTVERGKMKEILEKREAKTNWVEAIENNDGEEIERVKYIKYLGVNIENNRILRGE